MNTLYLKLRCPAVQPPLVVISNNGHNVIDFHQVVVGKSFLKFLHTVISPLYVFCVHIVLCLCLSLQEKEWLKGLQFRTFQRNLWTYPFSSLFSSKFYSLMMLRTKCVFNLKEMPNKITFIKVSQRIVFKKWIMFTLCFSRSVVEGRYYSVCFYQIYFYC